MNRYERAWAKHLSDQVNRGELAWWAYEAVNFRLANGCWYRPDFLVMLPDGTLEVHEVKGRWLDDALVKVKVFAEQWPMFRLRIVEMEQATKSFVMRDI